MLRTTHMHTCTLDEVHLWRMHILDSARSPFRGLAAMDSQHMLLSAGGVGDGFPPPPGRTAAEWQPGFCPWCQLWLRRCQWEGHARGAMHQMALAFAAAAARREAEQRQRQEDEEQRR